MENNTALELWKPISATITEKSGNYNVRGALHETLLKRDTHFGKPNEKLKQPIIYKAGTEAVKFAYGVLDRYAIQSIIEDRENGFFHYLVKCSLVAWRDDKEVVVSEGFGSSNTNERARGSASAFDSANVAIKMARKRSLTDAVINMAGLSAIFGQDLESEDFMSGAAAMTGSKPEDAITAKQRQRIFAIAASVGMSTEQCRTWLKSTTTANSPQGFASTKDITQADYDELCDNLKAAGNA